MVRGVGALPWRALLDKVRHSRTLDKGRLLVRRTRSGNGQAMGGASPSGLLTHAVGAPPASLNLGDVVASGFGPQRDGAPRQAHDLAAVVAHEVRMSVVFGRVRAGQLESPDVVPSGRHFDIRKAWREPFERPKSRLSSIFAKTSRTRSWTTDTRRTSSNDARSSSKST